MARYRLTKTTAGNATRNVGDQIVPTVEVRDNNTASYNQDTAGGAFPIADMGPFTEGTPSVAYNPNPLPVAGAGTAGISFGNIGAVAVLEYTIANNAWLQANIDLRDQTAANWRIQMFDGATVIQTLTPAQLDNTFYGPFNSGTVRLEIERLTDPIQANGDNEATITGYIVRTDVRSSVDFTDLVPATPAGTTRTWEIDTIYTDASIVTAIGATTGTGDITHTGIPFTVGGQLRYTITDTVTQAGVYQNTAAIAGTNVVATGNSTLSGQLVTIPAQVGTATVTKTTNAPNPTRVGSVVPSTVVVTMANFGGTTVVSDPIPAVPAGTTRTWTRVDAPAGNVTPAVTTGTGDINQTLVFAAPGTATYTINDTVNAAGNYQNIVSIDGGPDVPGGPDIPVDPVPPFVPPKQQDASAFCCPPPGPGLRPHLLPTPTASAEPCVKICDPVTTVAGTGADITLGGQDCTGAALAATGATGAITQIVQAPGQVLAVRMCAPEPQLDREMVVACNAAGDKVVVQYDVTTVPPTELARTNLNTGAAEPAGALVQCDNDDDDIEVVGVRACLNGVSLPGLAVVKDGGTGASTVLSELWRDPTAGTWGALPAGAVVGECNADEFFSQVFAEPGCAAGVPWTRRHVQTFTNGIPNAPQDFYVNSAGAIQLVAPAGFTLGACVPVEVPPTTANTPITFGQQVAAGTVAAGRQSVAITNVGTANATVNGGVLLPGQTVSFTAYHDPVTNVFNRLPAIPYVASATAILSISEVF